MIARLSLCNNPRLLRLNLHRPSSRLFCVTALRRLSEEARKTLDDAVKRDDIVLFMKGEPSNPQCGFSSAVLKLLWKQKIDHDKVSTYDILKEERLRKDLKEYSGWPTFPQLYVKGEFIGGCDILIGMQQNGELENMFKKLGLWTDAASETSSETFQKPDTTTEKSTDPSADAEITADKAIRT